MHFSSNTFCDCTGRLYTGRAKRRRGWCAGDLPYISGFFSHRSNHPQVDTIENQLVGTNWALVSYNGMDVDSGMTLNFSADTVSGSDGCNPFTGGVTISDGTLLLSDNLASTMMACPDMDAEMSRQYLDALLAAGDFTLDGDRLIIQT